MTTLYETRDRIARFYGRNEKVMQAILKFVLAAAAFGMINHQIGYMKQFANVPVTFLLALLCALLPANAVVVVSFGLVAVHLYALSIEVCVVSVVLMLVTALLYFRFSPSDGYNSVLTAVLFQLRIPYVMPVTVGLTKEPKSMVSVFCGTVFYFFLAGVKENEVVFSTPASDATSVSMVSIALKQMLAGKELLLVLITFAVMMLIVYLVRRMSIDYPWTVAFVSGIVVETVILLCGYLILELDDKIIWLLIGNVITILIAFAEQLMFFNLDYSRTERVQFEDDEYYYYVKAVPKIVMTEKEKQVKMISGNGSRFTDAGSISRSVLEKEPGSDSGQRVPRQAAGTTVRDRADYGVRYTPRDKEV